MTDKVRTLKTQVSVIDDIIENVSEYLDADTFQQLCDDLASARTTLTVCIKQTEEEENKPRELGTTWRTAFNPSELGHVAKEDLRLHFPFTVVEDTIRFKVSFLVKLSKTDEIAKQLHLSTKRIINNLDELNYDYLEF